MCIRDSANVFADFITRIRPSSILVGATNAGRSLAPRVAARFRTCLLYTSVDRILGKAKRKKIFDCEKDDIQIVAPADSFVLKDYEKQGMKVKDFRCV